MRKALMVFIGFMIVKSVVGAPSISDLVSSSNYPDQLRQKGTTDETGPGNYNDLLSSPQNFAINSNDNSIDEKNYLVGGGDIFRISIADLPSLPYIGTVNQNGDLFIPTFGIIPLGKITLLEAKTKITESLQRQLKRPNGIYITLQKCKTASITITGIGVSPGTSTVPGNLRLWDAIKASINQAKDPRLPPINLNEYNLREVCRINNDSISYFDLFSFMFKGDLHQNPYIYPGDRIHLSPARNQIYLGGEIRGALAGIVPILPDETAIDFFPLISLSPNADSEHILLQRNISENHSQKFIIDLTKSTIQETAPDGETNPTGLNNLHLKNGDFITVPSVSNLRNEFFVVSVTGEVAHPGLYPITKGSTTPEMIIKLSGEFTSQANRKKVVVIRTNKIPPATFLNKNSSILENLSPIRPEMSFSLNMMVSTKDFSVIDINKTPNIYLQPDDRIIIPRNENLVYVSGNVKRPGGYPFSPNQDRDYYINLAGGYSKKANKTNILIISIFGDAIQTYDRSVIEDGDIIVVPMSQEYKTFSMIFIPIASIVLTALSTTLALYSTLRK
jgi:polysaccharide biosynthesis/export protein